MVKVTTQAFPSYQIPRKEEEKSSLAQPNKSFKKQERFHNQTFVELKKLNQDLALIQKTQNSLLQIQKELKNIEHHHLQSPQSNTSSKLSSLQAKLTPILEDARKNHLFDFKLPPSLTLENLKDLEQKLSIEQNKLAHKLNETTQKIQHFFSSFDAFDLQEEMLKDPRFKEAHNIALLSSSAQTLTL